MNDYDTSLKLKVGDLVYFYFMHVICIPGRIDVDNAEPSTGKFEMRCRPARVTALHAHQTVGARPPIIDMGRCLLDLDVEFLPGDRRPLPGGCGGRFSRIQTLVQPHPGRDRMGEVTTGWPDPDRWARTSKMVDSD